MASLFTDQNSLLIFLHISFEKPLQKYRVLSFDLRSFQGVVVTVPVIVWNVEHRKTLPIENEIHDEPADSSITICKGMYCDEL